MFHSLPSEYGGIWNVIAQDDDECFDLITAQDADGFNQGILFKFTGKHS